MTIDDHSDEKWNDAVVSLLAGTTEPMKVKALRKQVFLTLQIEDDDKHFKKRYKKIIQTLEQSGQLKLSADGIITLGKKRKSEKETKKKKRSKQLTTEDGGDDQETKKSSEAEQNVLEQSQLDREKGQSVPGNPQGVTRLFLGNLPFSVDESSLTEFLPGVTHIKWITDKETGKFYGSAFVELDTPRNAASAVAKSGNHLMGRPIKVNYAPAREGDVWPPPKKVISGNQTSTTGGQAGGKGIRAMSVKPEHCTKLFIGNLSYDIDDETITKFFASVDAEIKAVRWIHHKDTGDFKGVGFVEFWNEEACEKAATLNGKDLLGRPIRIDWDGGTD